MPTEAQKKRRTWRDRDHSICGRLCGEEVEQGGWYQSAGRLANWLSPGELEAFEKRAYERSIERATKDPNGFIEQQCGGCRFFAALNADWGFCCNVASPNDGRVVFEHGGCAAHSNLSREIPHA